VFKFDLLENEKVVSIYRQTEAVLFKPVLVVFVLIYFPWYFLLRYGLASNYSRLLLFWTLLVFLYAAYKYILWLLNTYIITDKRLININYKNLFDKMVLESPLDKILNVSFFAKGLWQTLFDFGSVEVQVTGLSGPLVLKNIAHPSKVKDFLWQAHNRYNAAKVGQPMNFVTEKPVINRPAKTAAPTQNKLKRVI
jgi:hypothetical protein